MQIKSKEDELSKRFCSNADQQSFKEIYEYYWDYLFSVAFKKSKSNDIAQDLVQETFINLWKYRANFGHVSNLRVYLTTMLKYQFLKGIKQERIIFETLGDSHEFQYGSSKNDGFLQLEFEELYGQIQTVIESLPKKTKQIFLQNKIENRSIKEIAKELAITESAVRTHLSNANSTLKQELKSAFTLALVFWIFST